ncbi:MAG TPA: hypothetical protein QF656_01750 [Nitrosopumilus sp.]|jgi:hypothetical protein|nr:hypothetical protein [Nitrosopumilus sp.]
MPKNRNYTNLTVDRIRSEKNRENFKKLKIDQSFNTWTLDLQEAAIVKLKYLKQNYPDYAFAKLGQEGFAFMDKSKDEIFRIHFEGARVICSKHGKEQCDHKTFAAFHPQFSGGRK